MKNIILIGAGQLGSRHLQALKNINYPANIVVVEPSNESSKIAKERFDAITQNNSFDIKVKYLEKIPSIGTIDLAIVATNSNFRRKVIEELLNKNSVKYVILEKLLFDKKDDYFFIENLLAKNSIKVWVNCSMRKMPFYKKIKQDFENERIIYQVSGSQYGLVTNAIHYIDHMAYLVGNNDFEVDTNFLDKEIILSKRQGFFEFNGTLNVKFKDGSIGTMTCLPSGNLPIQVEIYSETKRYISKEYENKVFISRKENNWMWQEEDAKIPFQSQMTTDLVNDIFEKGTCELVNYKESMKTHLQLLEPLKDFYNKNSVDKTDNYLFT